MSFFSRFPKQFLIAQALPDILSDARTATFGPWRIAAADSVAFVRIVDTTHTDQGLLIGWPIHDGHVLRDGDILTLDAETDVTDLLRDVVGRYVFLYRSEGSDRLALDPAGLLPVVFDRARGIVASTPTVLGTAAPLTPVQELVDLFEFPKRRGFFPLGLTPFEGIERLLPNHTLNLTDFSVTRTWPHVWPPTMTEQDAPAAVAALAERVQRTTTAVLTAGRGASLFLSGGRDSRMVLAAAAQARKDLDCMSFGGDGTARDIFLAQKAAGVLGVPHRVVHARPVSKEDVDGWIERTGHCHYEPIVTLVTTMAEELGDRYALTGTCAEILRASNWTKDDLDTRGMSVEALLARIRIPRTPLMDVAAEAWLAPLADLPTTMLLDIAKIEHIHGCWAAPAVYGHILDTPTHHPFNDSAVYELALRLPPAYKLSQSAFRDFVRALYPALLEIPVNRVHGMDRLRFLKEEIRDATPTWLKRALKPFR